MVIDNLQIVRAIIPPHKADTPLLIYPYALLPFAVTTE
jgi:hypothetical protein